MGHGQHSRPFVERYDDAQPCVGHGETWPVEGPSKSESAGLLECTFVQLLDLDLSTIGDLMSVQPTIFCSDSTRTVVCRYASRVSPFRDLVHPAPDSLHCKYGTWERHARAL